MTFHKIQTDAEKAYAYILASENLSAIRPTVESLYRHFITQKDVADYAHLQAALCLLIEKDLNDAMRRLGRERSIGTEGAKTYILQSLNDALDVTEPLRDLLYEKGAILCAGRFFQVRKGFEKNGPFDRYRQKVQARYQPLIDHALQYAFSTKTRDGYERPVKVKPVTLPYIVAQLMDEGTEKEARLNALSIEKPREYAPLLAESYANVKSLSAHLGIDVSATQLLEGCPKETPAARLEQKIEDSALAMEETRIPVKLKVQEEPEANPADLRQELKSLVEVRAIGQKAALVYLWLQGGREEIRTENEAATRFKMTEEQVREIQDAVSAALDHNSGNLSPS